MIGRPGLDSRQSKFFLFPTASRLTLEPHTASYQMILGALSKRVKPQRRETDHSTLSSSKVKKRGALP
jgi:hypothetical protein